MDKTNTPEEIIDLVNENDEVIGEITKKEANSNPRVIHREIAVLLYDDRKRVLLQQRSYKKKVYPGFWDISTSGHIPKGLSPEKAAHNELIEELGFDTKLKFIYKKLLKFPNETHFSYFYLGKFPKDVRLNIYKPEVEQAKFFSKTEFKELKKIINYSLEDVINFWDGKYHI